MLPTERCLFSRGGSCWRIRVIFVFLGAGKEPCLNRGNYGEQMTCWRCEDTWTCAPWQRLGIRSVRGSAGMELMQQETAFSVFVGGMQLT